MLKKEEAIEGGRGRMLGKDQEKGMLGKKEGRFLPNLPSYTLKGVRGQATQEC